MRAMTLALTLSILSVTGCKKNIDPAAPFALSLHHCSQRDFGNGKVEICIDSIQDSRCPIGAMCFWQGVAQVGLSLNVNDTKRTFSLATLNISSTYRTDTTLMGYKIELLSVEPYPHTSVPIDPSQYKVELKITPH